MDAATFRHAIAYLLTPLRTIYPSQVLDALHLNLLSSFSHLDLPYTILLSPTAPPPKPIQIALLSLSHSFSPELRVHWQDWVLLLTQGSHQLVLALSAGSVQVTKRDTTTGLVSTSYVWNSIVGRSSSPWGQSAGSGLTTTSSSDSSESSRASSPVTLSQPEDVIVAAAESLLNDDEEDQMVYGLSRLAMPTQPPSMMTTPMMAPRLSLSATAPEWYPRHQYNKSSMGAIGSHLHHSRSSSRSSNISSTYSSSAPSNYAPPLHPSYTSQPSPYAVRPTTTSLVNVKTFPFSPTPSDLSESTSSEVVYVDATKDQKAVTEYECGKVGVLTGAVMLGVGKRGSPSKRA